MKIVINNCYGGFSFSEQAREMLNLESCYSYVERDDPNVIACVERLGSAANGLFAQLRIVDIPDNTTDWRIEEYDGAESVLYVVDGKIEEIE